MCAPCSDSTKNEMKMKSDPVSVTEKSNSPVRIWPHPVPDPENIEKDRKRYKKIEKQRKTKKNIEKHRKTEKKIEKDRKR